MPYTAQDHLDAFEVLHSDVDPVTALRYLNEVDEQILSVIPLRRTDVTLPIVSGQYAYDLDETILKVWSIDIHTTPSTYHQLQETDIDTLDIDYSNWRTYGPGDVIKWFEMASLTSGQIGFTPTPAKTTLTVTSATFATPIVITTQTHSLLDGDTVLISDVLVNTNANGLFYVDVLSPTTFALYTDNALTIPVAGNGIGTTGYIVTNNSPKLVLHCSQRIELLTSTLMPASPTVKPLYRFGMSALFMQETRLEGWQERVAQFGQMLGDASDMKMKRQARKDITISRFKQRMPWRGYGSKYNY